MCVFPLSDMSKRKRKYPENNCKQDQAYLFENMCADRPPVLYNSNYIVKSDWKLSFRVFEMRQNY